MERSQRAARSRAQNKTTTGSNKPQQGQGFVIYGADPQNADSDADPDATPAPQPKPATNKVPNGKDSGKH